MSKLSRRPSTSISFVILGILIGLIFITLRFLALIIFVAVLLCGLIYCLSNYLDVHHHIPLVAFFIPFTITIVDSIFVGFLPYFPDAVNYDIIARTTAGAWVDGNQPPTEIYKNLRVQAYTTLVSSVYVIFGHNPVIPIVLNCGLWGFAVAFWLRIGKEVFRYNNKDLYLPGVLLALSPAINLYTASLLREAVTLLLVVATLLYTCRWIDNNSKTNALAVTLLTIPTALFRPELVPTIWVAAIGAIVLSNSPTIILRTMLIVSIGVAFITSIIVVSLGSLPNYLNPFQLDLLRAKRSSNTHLSNPYLVNQTYDSWPSIILYLPERLFHLLYEPFFWDPSNFFMTIAAFDSLYMLSISPFAILGAIKMFQRTQGSKQRAQGSKLFLLAFGLLLLSGYAVTVSSKGAAPRRRMYVVPVMLLFVPVILPRIELLWKKD